MTAPRVPLLPEALQARYRTRRLLGAGSFGRVVLAEDAELGRSVAIKVLHDPGAAQDRIRFLREAEVLTRIRHEHVVEVYDSGEAADHLYLVMEYLDGAPPAAGSMGPEAAHELAYQVGAALETIHAAGAVHRDLKRANMLRVPGRGAVLIDFGLVRERQRTRLTAEGALVGTLPYVAPECLRGQRGEAASDWYALGVILYELVEGRHPFLTVDLLAVAEGEPLPAPGFQRMDAAAPLARVVRALLASDPGRRPVTRAALDRAQRSSGSSASRSRAMPAAGLAAGLAGPRPPGRGGPPWRLSLAALGIGTLGLVAALRAPLAGPGGDPGQAAMAPPDAAGEAIAAALDGFMAGHHLPDGRLACALRGGSYAQHLAETRASFGDPRCVLRFRRLLDALASWARAHGAGAAAAAEADVRITRDLLPAMMHLEHDTGMVRELINSQGYQRTLGFERHALEPAETEALQARMDELGRVVDERLPDLGTWTAPDRVPSMALRAALVGMFLKARSVATLWEALRLLQGTPEDPGRASLLLHGSYCLASVLGVAEPDCRGRERLADELLAALERPPRGAPPEVRVALAGRAVTQFFPALSRCGVNPGFEVFRLYDAAVAVLEREAPAAPHVAAVYLRWFTMADDVVLGSLMNSDPARWKRVGRRLRAVQAGLVLEAPGR